MLSIINEKKRQLYRKDASYSDQDVNFDMNVLYNMLRKRKSKEGPINSSSNTTVFDLCEQFCVSIPKKIEVISNKSITNIASNSNTLKPGGILIILDRDSSKYLGYIERALKKNVSAIFADTDTLLDSGIDITSLPVVPVKDGFNVFKKYYKHHRNSYGGKVIGITGSVGKTTTKGFVSEILCQQYNGFVSPVSQNAMSQITDNLLYKMTSENEFFVQEIGASSIGTIDTASDILNPDISIITNIKPHHLAAYGSIDNVFKDKISLSDNAKPNGTTIINYDDELLSTYSYKNNVITFGINTHKSVDYRAINISQNEDILSMDIVYSDMTVHINAHIIGDFNAYNILAAFALGKYMKIDDDIIVKGIESYNTSGIRQNVIHYGTNVFMIDCFNVSNETIINSVNVIEGFNAKNQGRKIAIIGGENTLGEYRIEKTRELGKKLASSSVDEIVCFGTSETTEAALNRYGDAVTLYETLKGEGFTNLKLITSFDDLVLYMSNEIKPDDIVLFKCIIYLNMPIAIDTAFGTNIALKHNPVLRQSTTKKIDGIKGILYAYMNEAYITDIDKKIYRSTKVTIPNTFGDMKIFGINKGLFAYSKLRSIDFGNTIKQIGVGAFRECKNVTSIELPDSVLHIMEGAFKNCSGLKSVRIGSGIKQIDKNAFAGCASLNTIFLPNKKGFHIDDTAFPKNAMIHYY